MQTLSPLINPNDFNPLENLQISLYNCLYVIYLEFFKSDDSHVIAISFPNPFSICLSIQL